MASTTDEETENKRRMWALQQQFDQPMDEEAVRIKTMFDQNVCSITLSNSQFEVVDSN
uniref:Uncharacterized protein n=1 Tax=Rhizophora mucronata TaxID=61149 RepID=A0A2P2P059_RHIMU